MFNDALKKEQFAEAPICIHSRPFPFLNQAIDVMGPFGSGKDQRLPDQMAIILHSFLPIYGPLLYHLLNPMLVGQQLLG